MYKLKRYHIDRDKEENEARKGVRNIILV